ncbi:hypothetical protein GUITHDRAFT_150728 [Guillardia theta CCMP2712]|uniref:Uncharacterized protein n=1 Tax=Guillardia theta (strain CCMP2712) TaxID=905079 RepID=L1JUI6_GUITC|nr:hypothetical protein GUITHDRAFT_150728 [Guillardia theta CCMP2712]EKX52231.1 hypothetical protein GUITHDRAFT_150728 [Guillardia theta CCMP2712]|eukprot:XP_005839211.1 hypothetical protein GUITHDRAFT_150728 [Guillardia theta CCMP2712]
MRWGIHQSQGRSEVRLPTCQTGSYPHRKGWMTAQKSGGKGNTYTGVDAVQQG